MNAPLPINLMLVEDERVIAFDLKNQLQSFGTHNSYKEKIPDVEMALINERLPKVGPKAG